MTNKPIKDWAEDDRPREKLLNKGAAALSNAELLAILINSGSTYGSAVDVAKILLDSCENKLNLLSRLSVNEILERKIPGIGQVKAILIHAALSLNTRKEAEDKTRLIITCSKDIADFLTPLMEHLQHEVFMVVFLNNANHVLSHKVISSGGITGTTVDLRLILKLALQNNAVALIIAHNHPSGSLKPSVQDIEITKNIRSAAQIMNIRLLDHIIISDHGFYSFLDNEIFE